MPSSWRGAHWVLVYGEYGWPPYYSPKEKLKEYEEWGLTQWQIKSSDHTLQYSLWQKICTLQNVRKGESFRFTSVLSFQTTHDIHKTIFFTRFFSPTITSFDFLQRSPRALFSLPDDYIQFGDKLQIGDCIALGNTLVNCQLSLVTGDTPNQRGMLSWPLLHLQSLFGIMNDVANG